MSRSSNLHYLNLEKDPEKLHNSINKEISHYSYALNNVLKNMDVTKYGVKWREIRNYTYNLSLFKIIRIPKPKFEIALAFELEDETFSPEKLSVNWERLLYRNFRQSGSEIIIEIEHRLKKVDVIRYEGTEIPWVFHSGFNSNDLQLTLAEDVALNVLNHSEENPDFIEIFTDTEIDEYNDLFYGGGNEILEFSVIDPDIRTLTFSDQTGEVPINTASKYRGQPTLQTTRKLKGSLYSDAHGSTLPISYELVPTNEKTHWIELLEDGKGESTSVISPGSSIVDLFLDLLLASPFLSISSIQKDGKKKQQIKVWRVNRRELTLQVQHLPPKGSTIYPPRADNQLRKQKNALHTLQNTPSPHHRNLLKLFERSADVRWDDAALTQPFEKQIEWRFLVEENNKLRDGTEYQREFVQKALTTPDYAILEGPPGSGKTTVLTELIHQLILQGKRILLSASTHVAIDNVVENLLKHFESPQALMENNIVPLRIGREGSISKDVLPFQIDYKKEILQKKLENTAPFDSYSEEELDEAISNLVVLSSNLVCGTILGILQYPNFKKESKGSRGPQYIKPEFDYLIIDEASKTTVQEFLVPATHAKKWIIAGDVKQLSPYMESLYIRASLENFLQNKALETALLLYFVLIFEQGRQRAENKRPLPQFLIPLESSKVINEFLGLINHDLVSEDKRRVIQREAIQNLNIGIISSSKINVPKELKEYVDVIASNNFVDLMDSTYDYAYHFKILAFDMLFIVQEDYEVIKDIIPAKYMVLSEDTSEVILKHRYRHEYWYNKTKNRYSLGYERDYERIRDNLIESMERNWAGQLSWRLGRVYELEEVTENNKTKNYYLASMHALLPQRADHRRYWGQIQKLGQILFPSILKCLQEGIRGQYSAKNSERTVLSSGIPESSFKLRHSKLVYQHRMEDTIAQIPRALFYTPKDGGRPALLTSKEMTRAWPNNLPPAPYNSDQRIHWNHIAANDGRNHNEREIKEIMKTLKQLIKWSKKANSQEWTVGIITYYNRQRMEIVKTIKKQFPKVNQRAITHFRIDGLQVVVYTVDKIQGREVDISLISMVRNKKLGFMDSPNRLNVAITRAKYLQIIFGNVDFFSKCDSPSFKSLIKKIKNKKSVHGYNENSAQKRRRR